MEEIEGYKLLDKIGEGGMATVYKGQQVSLNRPVAIKFLSNRLVIHPDMIERFKRESLVIASLNNPHIIHVIDRGITPRGTPYFIMEYVEGTDLATLIHVEKPDFNRKLELIIQVCKALSYAHKNGVIHRDIKPGNILIDSEGNARVLDFGIAQFYGDEDRGAMHTRPGTLMGTLPYMSPEQQTSADKVTTLSDLYSLGVLMYEVFTGLKPLGRFKLPSEIDHTIPKHLEAMIMCCMNQEPLKRPGTPDDIKDVLLKLLRGAHLQTTQRERAGRGIVKFEDKFALLDVIKEKPCGSVYLYEEKTNQKLLVIKKKPSTNAGFMEAKLLTSLKHRNIVNILGASRNEQLFIIVMEYLSGGSLNDRLIKPYPLEEFLRTAREICEGLSFAHKNRIVHGNLRPSNILFSDIGQVKIADFGLNEHYAESKDISNWYSIKREPRSPHTDIFAAGVIFYQMLTGTMPPVTDVRSDQNRHFKYLPFDLREMVLQMLSRKRESRQNNFDEIITQIDAFLEANMGKTASGADADIDKTELIDRSEKLDRSAAETIWTRPWHFIWIFLFMTALSAMAVGYLAYTGKLEKCINVLVEAWKVLLEQFDPLYREKLLPAWEKLQQNLIIFLKN